MEHSVVVGHVWSTIFASCHHVGFFYLGQNTLDNFCSFGRSTQPNLRYGFVCFWTATHGARPSPLISRLDGSNSLTARDPRSGAVHRMPGLVTGRHSQRSPLPGVATPRVRIRTYDALLLEYIRAMLFG